MAIVKNIADNAIQIFRFVIFVLWGLLRRFRMYRELFEHAVKLVVRMDLNHPCVALVSEKTKEGSLKRDNKKIFRL